MDSSENMMLSEIEMLTSMYPKEFQLDDPSCLVDLKEFVQIEPPTRHFDTRLRFTLKLESVEKVPFEVTVDLPSKYPVVFPDVSIRTSAFFCKKGTDALNANLIEFMSRSLSQGEPSVLSIIQWINDNVDNYIGNQDQSTSSDLIKPTKPILKEDEDVRYWIYSHHIRNKTKRKMILDSAREFNLTGFSCPGKPGIICIEGAQRDAGEFWQRIRSLQWQRITLKHQESPSCDAEILLNSWRKFKTFEEKCFQSVGSRHGHTDTGKLLQFLQSHECQHIFPIYFGVSGSSLTSENS